jgi:serine/threonine protein kinase
MADSYITPPQPFYVVESVDENQQVVQQWKSWERHFVCTTTTFTKSEITKDELIHRKNGDRVDPIWGKERLQNEAATLQYIRANTSIPVPRCRLYERYGLLHLETDLITNGIQLGDVDQQSRQLAYKKVDEQMKSAIIPQLRQLRRNFVGSVDPNIPVFPPQRIFRTDRRSWPRISHETDDFVLCHNDLSPHNIFVDPNSFSIVSIIDWEYAGFYPQEFELPLWTTTDWKGMNDMWSMAEDRDLAFFRLLKDDLKDCIPLYP